MEEEKKYCVYKHTNKINGKVYIGQTCQNNPNRRWRNGDGYKCSPLFYNAIQKYGWDNFEHEILENNLSLEQANILEAEFIKKYKSNNSLYGYNITPGGQNYVMADSTKEKLSIIFTGRKHSEETKKKMSKSHIGKKHTEEEKRKISEAQKGEKGNNYGKKMSKETKRKISEASKGKEKSLETREKLSMANKGKRMSDKTKKILSEQRKGIPLKESTKEKLKEHYKTHPNPMYGKHHTEETKEKIRNTKLGKKKALESRLNDSRNIKVKCIETNVIYPSINIASEKTSISATGIIRCCKGKQKTAGGCHWEYV